MPDSDQVSDGNSIADRLAALSAEKRVLLRQRLECDDRRGYDVVAESLRSCGITHVYGVAGRPTEEILPACARQGIRPIGVYHQSSAVFMAQAQNYVSGRMVAVALVSAGPAVTNAVTGLHVAHENGWPVIVLGGQRRSFQKLNVSRLISPITKHAVEVSSTTAIPNAIRHAFQVAMSGRPGPAYIDLHEDCLAGRAKSSTVESEMPAVTRPVMSDADVTRITSALLAAHRPALLIGKGIRWSVVPQQLRELVERLAIPFITSPMGRGFLSDDHPLCFNQARSALQSSADLVIVLGARLNWVFRHGSELSRTAHVIRVDIVGVDEELSVPTDTVIGDAGDCVERVLRSLHDRERDVQVSSQQETRRSWIDALTRTKEETQRRLNQLIVDDSLPMSPFRMMRAVRDTLPRETILVADGNVSMMAAQQVISSFGPASRLDPGTTACMGTGLSFAIGAKIASPERPVVAVTGDYAFSLGVMEMETCVRNRIPIVVLVANNQGNNGDLKQTRYFPSDYPDRVTTFQPDLQYHQIMEAFGGQGATITDPDMLPGMVREAIRSQQPTCLNVMINPSTPPFNAWGSQANEVFIAQ